MGIESQAEASIHTVAATANAAFSSVGSGESVLNLRLSQNYAAVSFGKLVNVLVPVAKPPKANFFQVHPGQEYSTILNLLDGSKLGNEGMYAVGPEVAPLVQDQLRLTQLRLGVTSQGAPYLVPVPLAGPDGRLNAWHLSLARAVDMAQTRWIRLSANMMRGGYDVFEAIGQLPEPQWPVESFENLLEIAFKGRVITDESHLLVQQLLGA